MTRFGATRRQMMLQVHETWEAGLPKMKDDLREGGEGGQSQFCNSLVIKSDVAARLMTHTHTSSLRRPVRPTSCRTRFDDPFVVCRHETKKHVCGFRVAFFFFFVFYFLQVVLHRFSSLRCCRVAMTSQRH